MSSQKYTYSSHLGMTCQPSPHAKHGQVLAFNVSTPSRTGRRAGPRIGLHTSHRIAFATLQGSESLV